MYVRQKAGCSNDSHSRLLEEVKVATRSKRLAERNYRKAVRRAQTAGVPVEEEVVEPSFKLKEGELHIFPGGRHPRHGHIVMRLAGELSPACLAELADKVMNGRVTYDRPFGERHGWWNYCAPDEELFAMTGD
jgi:hypothetical protein